MADEKPADGGWRLDRTIPLALLFAAIVQLLSWYWGEQKESVKQGERLVRVEERVSAIQDALKRIEENMLRSRDSSLPSPRR